MHATHLVTPLVLLVAPSAEETWLRDPYGDAYVRYCRTAPRYL